MNTNYLKATTVAILLSMTYAGLVQAQEEPSECVIGGALAYDNWTKTDSGGTGALPEGVQSSDYIRCKACHGWDHMGTDGGYVRRSRRESRPNAGAGDGDSTSRNISLAARGGDTPVTDRSQMMIIREGMVITCLIMVGPASGKDWPISPSIGAMAALVTMINKEIDKIAGFFVSIEIFFLIVNWLLESV